MDVLVWPYRPGAAVAEDGAAPPTTASSSAASASVSSSSPPSSFLLFPGQHGAPHEEEIYVSGRTAVWSTGHVPVVLSQTTAARADDSATAMQPVSRVLKSFTHSVPVISALLTRFPTLSSTASQPALSIVLVHPDSLSIYTASDVYSVPLPFQVTVAHPLLEGLLLARSTPSTPHTSAPPAATPCLFSLLHPLEEVRPVARARGVEGEAEYMMDDQEAVVWASDQQPLLLTYQAVHRRHRLYVIRQSSRERHKRLKATPTHIADGRADGGEMNADKFAAHLLSADSEGLAAAADRVIASELLLDCCWADVSAVGEYSEVFLASTVDGQPLLCMCGRQSGAVNAYFLKSFSAAVSSSDAFTSPFLIAVESAFSIPALSACPTRRLFSPVHSLDTPHPSPTTNPYDHDIIVLSSNGRLSVYCGDQLLHAVDSSSVPVAGLRLSHSVMDRFCLHTATDCYRVQQPAAVKSAVVSACMQAVAYVLPVTAMLAIKRDWLSRKHANDAGPVPGSESEWQLFASLMLDLLSPVPSTASTTDNNSVVSFVPLASSSSVSPLSPAPSRSASRRTRQMSTSPAPDSQHGTSDAWSTLLASSFHRRHAAHPLLTKLHSSTAIHDSTQQHAPHEQKRQKTTPIPPAASARPLVQQYAAEVLLMLHLVYEECKLDELLMAHLQPLATMCHAIARRLGAKEWCEQYQRDCAGLRMASYDAVSAAAVVTPVSTLLSSPPPSIYRWVYQRLRSPGDTVPFSLPPDAINDLHTPFPLLRRVCECYELMTDPKLATSQYSLTADLPDWSDGIQPSIADTAAVRSSLSTPSLRALSTPQSPFSFRPSRKRRESPTSALSLRSTHSTASIASRAGLLDISEDSHPLFSPSSARRASTGRVRPDVLPSSSGVSAAFRVALLSSFDGAELARLPFGVSLPLYQHLYDMRHSPSAALSVTALQLIGRSELACMQAASTATPSTAQSSLLDKMERAAGQPQSAPPPLPPSTIADDHPTDTDGTLLTLRIASSRFAADLRLKQVRHLLRSNRIVHATLSAARIQGLIASAAAPPDIVIEQQARLLTLSRRILSLPIGRGMFTLGTVHALLTRPWTVPELIVKGVGTGVGGAKAATNDFELDGPAMTADFWDWPHFHNGVAAALRIRPSVRAGEACVTRSYILFNRPATLDFSHAGWLFGLGLNGGLACLTAADLYSYLSQHHDATTVALLLGMAAVKRGSLDLTASKMLCLHLPAFLPSHLQSEVSGVVRAAAVVGIGLVYEGSAHRLMTDVLLGEVEGRGRGRDKDKCNDAERTGYALAAGFGLGLVLLGRGGNALGVSDLRIEDRLIALLQHNTQLNSNNDESNGATPASSTPLHNLDVTAPAATVALALMYCHSNNADIASHLTIPATHYELDYVKAEYLLLRTMARGLVLSDGVQATRQWVEGQVPAIVAGHVNGADKYCKWNGAEGSKAARKLDVKGRRSVMDGWDDDDRDEDENMSGAANRSTAVAAGFDLDSIIIDSDDERAYVNKTQQPRQSQPITSKRVRAPAPIDSDASDDEQDDDLDYEAIRQAYCNIIAGACLALGFQQAGTADAAAASLLSYYVRVFRNIRFKLTDHSHTLSSSSPTPLHHVDRYTLESCLHSCLFALCLVMAGTGDLATLRLLLSTRQRVEERSAFSREQGWSMCLGLLFLGGGEWSVKRGKSAIGPLLLSLFPTFPSGTASSDNRLYLQPLRHMYALSAECRTLKAIDVDGGGECYCQLEVKMKNDGRLLRLVTPCLLPEVSGIESVRLVDERYWPITVSFASSARASSGGGTASDIFTFPARTSSPYLLHVKRASSRILRSLDAPSFVNTLDRIQLQHQQDYSTSVSSQPSLIPPAAVSALDAGDDDRLVAAVCDSDEVSCAYSWLVAEADGQEREQLASLLLECVRDDKMHTLPLLLRMRRGLTDKAAVLDASGVWSMRCVEQFYEQRHSSLDTPPALWPAPSASIALASPDFRSRLQYQLAAHFPLSSSSSLSRAFRSYLSPQPAFSPTTTEWRDSLSSAAACRELSCYLTYADMPSADVLTAGLGMLRQVASGIDIGTSGGGFGKAGGHAASLSLLVPIAGMIWPSLTADALQFIVGTLIQTE